MINYTEKYRKKIMIVAIIMTFILAEMILPGNTIAYASTTEPNLNNGIYSEFATEGLSWNKVLEWGELINIGENPGDKNIAYILGIHEENHANTIKGTSMITRDYSKAKVNLYYKNTSDLYAIYNIIYNGNNKGITIYCKDKCLLLKNYKDIKFYSTESFNRYSNNASMSGVTGAFGLLNEYWCYTKEKVACNDFIKYYINNKEMATTYTKVKARKNSVESNLITIRQMINCYDINHVNSEYKKVLVYLDEYNKDLLEKNNL